MVLGILTDPDDGTFTITDSQHSSHQNPEPSPGSQMPTNQRRLLKLGAWAVGLYLLYRWVT